MAKIPTFYLPHVQRDSAKVSSAERSPVADLKLLREIIAALVSGEELGFVRAMYLASYLQGVADRAEKAAGRRALNYGKRSTKVDASRVAEFIDADERKDTPMAERFRQAGERFGISAKTARRYWNRTTKDTR